MVSCDLPDDPRRLSRRDVAAILSPADYLDYRNSASFEGLASISTTPVG